MEEYQEKYLKVPKILKKLIKSDIDLGYGEMANELDFSLKTTENGKLIDRNRTFFWGVDCQDHALFEKHFIFLAEATIGGGFYAFFISDLKAKIEDQPIVFLGDEGEVAVCAENLNDWLCLISIGGRPHMYGQHFDISEPEEEEQGENLEVYRAWLSQQGLEPYSSEKELTYSETITQKAEKYLADVVDKVPFLSAYIREYWD